ncbi:unnamed protein product [Haemonchus placei]|uniref:C2H2-type domain-containing protein n=1 Tax=Haemonchus placei TaxID=6290 RepID=A0A3P7SRD7_HAEPC|nr:unnamed protein product [Haemonchus placei]
MFQAHLLPGPSLHRTGKTKATNYNQEVCGKSLSSKRSYDEHMNIHNDARPFACEHCDYAAASQMTLRRHKLRSHTARRDWGYKCPYCYEAYMEPASYQQHVQSRHFGRSATFGCPYMQCTFQSKCFRHFREHLAKHNSIFKWRHNASRQAMLTSCNMSYRPLCDCSQCKIILN